MSLEQILTSIGTPPENSRLDQLNLRISESALPLLNRFFQDLGFGPEQIKGIISDLDQGGGFDVETLRTALLKYGQTNLKEITLSGVDQKNLKELFTALGARPGDFRELFGQLEKSGGKISAEEFLSILKEITGPRAIQPSQAAHLGALMENLRSKSSLRVHPKFNRIISLLQSLADDRTDQNFSKNSPAVAILRQGSASARALARGDGFGPEQESRPSFGPHASDSAGSGTEKLFSEFRSAAGLNGNRAVALAESVFKQVAEKIAYSLRNDQHRIRIQLEPKELGQIKINLIYNNNNLKARIITEHAFVKDALDTQWTQLSRVLSQQGITLERFDVSLDSNQAGLSKEPENQGEHQDNQKAGSRGIIEPASQPADESELFAYEPLLSNNQVDLRI